MTSAAPRGYTTANVGKAWVVARPDDLKWVTDAIESAGTLYDFARQASTRAMRGRGNTHSVARAGRSNAIVRHYIRGGAIAPLLGDRYLRAGTARPVHELGISEVARERGVRTPPVLAAIVYPSGLWYRADLVTEEIPAVETIADLLLRCSEDDCGRTIAHHALQLLDSLVTAGIHHRDYNVRNILISTARTPSAHVIDLDGASIVKPGSALRESMLRRLRRSVEKLAATEGLDARALRAALTELA